MDQPILHADHIILTSTTDIQKICQKFFKVSGIELFVFNRTYMQDYQAKHNRGFFLSNHTAWAKHFLTYDYMHRISMIGVNAVGTFDGYKILLCSLFEDNLMLKNLKEVFNIDHGILVCKQYDDYCEWYTFAASRDNPQILHYYLNHFDELIQFILYFKDKARDIIKKAIKANFQLPKPTQSNKLLNNDKAIKTLFQKNNNTFSNQKIIELGSQLVTLSKRESECLALLQKGYTANTIGELLHISQRTVEGHLQNIYQKLGCHSKDQLLRFLSA